MRCPQALVVDLILNREEVLSVGLAIDAHEDVARSRPAPRSLRPMTDCAHTSRAEHPRILACRRCREPTFRFSSATAQSGLRPIRVIRALDTHGPSPLLVRIVWSDG